MNLETGRWKRPLVERVKSVEDMIDPWACVDKSIILPIARRDEPWPREETSLEEDLNEDAVQLEL